MCKYDNVIVSSAPKDGTLGVFFQVGVLPSTGEPRDVKVNQFHYKPGVVQRVLRNLRFPDFVTTAQDGGKVVSLTHRLHFTPGKCSFYSFLLEAESTPGP